MGMVNFICTQEWCVDLKKKPYVSTVAEQLQTFDSKFGKYQLAFGHVNVKIKRVKPLTCQPWPNNN
jgi:hypothetical protein